MKRALFAVITCFALLLTPIASGAVSGRTLLLKAYRDSADIVTAPDGRILDLYGPAVTDTAIDAQAFIAGASDLLFQGEKPDLRLSARRQSLTGVHFVYQQFLDSEPVIGGALHVDVDRSGNITELHNRVGRLTSLQPARLDEDQSLAALRRNSPGLVLGDVEERTIVLLRAGADVRRAWRIVTHVSATEPYEFFVDAATGELLLQQALFFNAAARVFDPNPVVKLNSAGLQDQNDAAGAVPEAAYSNVELQGLSGSGPLAGPNVRIVDREQPFTTAADVSLPLTFDRSIPAFEEVMVYFHLDRSQRYLQSLGYTGPLRIVAAPLEVDAHGGVADNSFYTLEGPGQGRIYFGDGGVDDAEDADIVLHEYGHAIHDSIAPGVFMGPSSSEGRAISEGFGDYWAFSSNFLSTVDSGRDPFCIGDWDARCADGPSSNCSYPKGADCLRRVDSSKTMDDFIFSNSAGTEHRNGEIWSSSLRRLFVSLTQRYGRDEGRKTSDRLVLEGMYGTPPSPTFKVVARQIIDADRILYGGANSAAICAAMVPAKILTLQECSSTIRGDLTFFQSSDRRREIPDGDQNGIISGLSVNDDRVIDQLYVQVKIEHPFLGDIQLTLIAPDGTTVLLQQALGNAGTNLDTVYGLTSVPAESLDVLRGKSARGEWKLHLVDGRGRDVGSLISWGLIIRFTGAEVLTVRPARIGPVKFLPVVVRAPGVAGSFFRSDVRLFNGGSADAHLTAFFTPGGADGTAAFSAIQLVIAAGQVLTVDDILASLFFTAGIGALELRGDVGSIRITSRIYTGSDTGTFGQFVEGVDESETAMAGQPTEIPQLQSDAEFRTNVGFAETAGAAGVVRTTVYDGAGTKIQTIDTPLLPFSHVQFPILGGGAGEQLVAARAEVSLLSGGARVAAYASVVDNRSGDAIYIPAVRRPEQARTVVVPVVIHADGVPPARWRSEVWLVNPDSPSASLAAFFYSATGEEIKALVQSPDAGASLVLDDVVQTVFSKAPAAGQLVIPDTRLIVTSRAWTPISSGSAGQFVAARETTEAIGIDTPAANAIQIEASERYRTNVGMTEVTGAPVTVRIRLLDAGGFAVFERVVQIAAHGQLQVNLQGEGAPPTSSGRVQFQVISGQGKTLCYASVVDNLSGDAIYVPAR
ncbi:MAG: proprotein convertase P-domain-containing protein [Acidobacteriota bacterium]